MAEGIINSSSQNDKPDDRRIYGVVTAQVITNCDQTLMGRVKVRFPWLPGYEPWARVATLMAGLDGGTFFIPQQEEEVLVAFNHGYVNEPYIVGSLWNGRDKPHEMTAKDPIHQRAIRTPEGHELAFDDSAHSITITNPNGAKVTLTPEKIELVIGSASIVLQKGGDITLKGETITLNAKTINVEGSRVNIKGTKGIAINGGSDCSIDAAKINIG